MIPLMFHNNVHLLLFQVQLRTHQGQIHKNNNINVAKSMPWMCSILKLQSPCNKPALQSIFENELAAVFLQA